MYLNRLWMLIAYSAFSTFYHHHKFDCDFSFHCDTFETWDNNAFSRSRKIHNSWQFDYLDEPYPL